MSEAIESSALSGGRLQDHYDRVKARIGREPDFAKGDPRIVRLQSPDEAHVLQIPTVGAVIIPAELTAGMQTLMTATNDLTAMPLIAIDNGLSPDNRLRPPNNQGDRRFLKRKLGDQDFRFIFPKPSYPLELSSPKASFSAAETGNLPGMITQINSRLSVCDKKIEILEKTGTLLEPKRAQRGPELRRASRNVREYLQLLRQARANYSVPEIPEQTADDIHGVAMAPFRVLFGNAASPENITAQMYYKDTTAIRPRIHREPAGDGSLNSMRVEGFWALATPVSKRTGQATPFALMANLWSYFEDPRNGSRVEITPGNMVLYKCEPYNPYHSETAKFLQDVKFITWHTDNSGWDATRVAINAKNIDPDFWKQCHADNSQPSAAL